METKKKVILHIGTHKSGSTSIQNFLYPNFEVLLNNKIDFVRELCIWNTAHHPLGWCMQNDFVNIDENFEYDKNKGVMHYYIQKIIDSNAEIIVLSTETLFACTDFSKLKKFHDILSEHVTFEVVVYLRHQSSFLFSWYSELVTAWYGKITADFKSFLDNPRYPANYNVVLDNWARVFGKESLRVNSFDEIVRNEGLINHFIDSYLAGVNKDDFNIPKDFSRVSLDFQKVELVRQINELGLTDEKREEEVKVISEASGGPLDTSLLSSIQLTKEQIFMQYKDSNRLLNETYGVDINKWYKEKI